MRLFLFLSFICSGIWCCAQVTIEEKTLVTTTGNLSGTMLIPAAAKKFALVIIQAGSGPTDRNGNSGKALTANSYRLIAETLIQKNIACLLVDKRGVAGSSAALKKDTAFKFTDYAIDLADWVRFAKKDKRINKIVIAGHSEGALVGMLAAQQEKINGYISIAGAGESIDKIIRWQIEQQLPKAAPVIDSLFYKMRNNTKIDTVPPYLMSIFAPSLRTYILSWMLVEPCKEIAKLKMPVLILQGTTDIQVQVAQADKLKACKPTAKLIIINGMNHILKQTPLNREENIASYSNKDLPVTPQLIDEIVLFVNKTK